MFIDNPSLKRIINIWGTADWISDGDFGPPTPSTPSTFSGASPSGVENVNIRIIGAFHNDFSYNPNDYADRTLWGEKEVKREFINKTTNFFMRRLYDRALEDQKSPGDLLAFLESLEADGSARLENGMWIIDPFKLKL